MCKLPTTRIQDETSTTHKYAKEANYVRPKPQYRIHVLQFILTHDISRYTLPTIFTEGSHYKHRLCIMLVDDKVP